MEKIGEQIEIKISDSHDQIMHSISISFLKFMKNHYNY